MGAQLNIQVFDRELVLAAIAISILAFISKLAGCGLPVLRFGWKTAAKVGIGMVPRGEVGLIVALNGLQLNAISERTYAIVIFMTGVTTMIAPPLLKLLFQAERQEMTVPSEGRSTAM
jgi:Kef-type K+ transport system membrane component KefB